MSVGGVTDVGGYMMRDGFMSGAGLFWMIFGFLFLVLVIVGTVVLIVFLFSHTARGAGGGMGAGIGAGAGGRNAALEELEKRYARGEIGRDEFLEKRQDLS